MRASISASPIVVHVELVIEVDQTDPDAYLLMGNSVVQGGSVTVESRATIDCFGFNYSAGALSPAWGVYFSSSIALNTRSFSASGQLPVYDATAGELAAGDLGDDLTFSFSPVNYDNTRGGTVTGNAVGDQLRGQWTMSLVCSMETSLRLMAWL